MFRRILILEFVTKDHYYVLYLSFGFLLDLTKDSVCCAPFDPASSAIKARCMFYLPTVGVIEPRQEISPTTLVGPYASYRVTSCPASPTQRSEVHRLYRKEAEVLAGMVAEKKRKCKTCVVACSRKIGNTSKVTCDGLKLF